MAGSNLITQSETVDATTAPVSEVTVQAAACSDRNAQREIYQATGERVYRLMVRMVGRQEADDLTQQVFLQAFRKMGQFNGQSKFETWLYRLATNEALQSLRKSKRHATQELLSEPAVIFDNPVEAAEDIRLVQHALGQLSPELRAIISLKEDSGLSYQEIAEAIGVPEGTVGSRLNRARRELRAILERNGFEG